jgi:hypothetical protein
MRENCLSGGNGGLGSGDRTILFSDNCVRHTAGTIDDVGAGSISGKLFTEDNTSVDYPVTVVLYNSESVSTDAALTSLSKITLQADLTVKSIETDSGYYRFDSLSTGDYRIAVFNDDITVGTKNDFTLAGNEAVRDTLYMKEVITL